MDKLLKIWLEWKVVLRRSLLVTMAVILLVLILALFLPQKKSQDEMQEIVNEFNAGKYDLKLGVYDEKLAK